MWKERKRIWCGLPWTFTVYSFDDQRFFIESGVFNKKEEEVRLYRIKDLTVTRSFMQRIFGMGTIHVDSADMTLGCFDIKNIKNVKEVKEKLAERVEAERDRKRVTMREYSGDIDDDHDTL